MYDLIKEIASVNSWGFEYSRRDFSNLYDKEETTAPVIFLDPVTTTDDFDEYGTILSKSYSGSFMVLLSSNLDEEDYDSRYQKYIRPLVNGALSKIKESIKCTSSMSIESWREVEIINVFDYGFDGIVVTFSVKHVQ